MIKQFNWGKVTGRGGAFTAAQLSLALQEWVGAKDYTKGKKVNENITDLERRFKSIRIALVVSMHHRHAANRLLVPQ